MTFKRENKNGCAHLKVAGALSVVEAEVFRKELVECLESSDGLILDLNEVSDCDVAGIQLLHSARISAENAGKSFAIEGASLSLLSIIACAGVDPDVVLKAFRTN